MTMLPRLAALALALSPSLPLLAAEQPAAVPAPPTSDAEGLPNQKLIGPPYLSFGRLGSGTNLPSYPFATASYLNTFKADLDGAEGDVSAQHVALWAPILPLNAEKFHLLAFFGYRGTWTDSTFGDLLPESDLHRFSLPIAFIHDISERWIWGGLVMPGYAGELDSWNSDGFSLSVALAVGYAYSPSFNIGGGLYYYHGFGDDLLLPGVAFTWRPDQNTEVYLLPPFGGVNRAFGDWSLGLYGAYDSPTWNITASEEAPSRDVNMSCFRLGAKAEHKLFGFAYGYAMAGVELGRSIKIDRPGNGDTLLSEDIKPAPYIQIGLTGRF